MAISIIDTTLKRNKTVSQPPQPMTSSQEISNKKLSLSEKLAKALQEKAEKHKVRADSHRSAQFGSSTWDSELDAYLKEPIVKMQENVKNVNQCLDFWETNLK